MITDPTEHIPGIAESHGWDYEVDEDGQANVHIPGDWNEYQVSLLWQMQQEILIVRAVIPAVPVPDIFVPELCLLLNKINGMCLFGAWYYQPDDEQQTDWIVWRKEVHGQAEPLSSERTEQVLIHTRSVFDTYYPAITHFLAQKVVVTPEDGVLVYSDLSIDADEAIEYIAHGGATKGRA